MNLYLIVSRPLLYSFMNFIKVITNTWESCQLGEARIQGVVSKFLQWCSVTWLGHSTIPPPLLSVATYINCESASGEFDVNMQLMIWNVDDDIQGTLPFKKDEFKGKHSLQHSSHPIQHAWDVLDAIMIYVHLHCSGTEATQSQVRSSSNKSKSWLRWGWIPRS